MFLRQAKSGPHTYLRLVENYHQGDKVRQRVIDHLGRKDLLVPHLDALVRLLQGGEAAYRAALLHQVSGDMLLPEPELLKNRGCQHH